MINSSNELIKLDVKNKIYVEIIKSDVINNYLNNFMINGSYLNNSSVFCYNNFQFKKYKFRVDSIKLEEELLEALRENININKQIRINNNSVEKILISPKEFNDMFGIGIESQKQLRRRLKHPLPYVQINEFGSIKYKIKIVKKWFENYEKNN